MPIRYISTKSTYLYTDAETNDRELVLIFGDEVETTGQQENDRDEVRYRDRPGWVLSDRLMSEHPLEI